MGNALEFILKLQDMLSPGMKQAAQISDSAANKISAQFSNIENKGKRMGASLNELRERLDAVNKIRANTTYAKEFDIATQAAKRLETQIDKLQGKKEVAAGGGFFKTMFAMAGGNLISNAFMNAGDWFREGKEKAELRHQAIAQINASLKSTGGAAGLSFGDVESSAKQVAGASQYSTTQMLKMQSVLLTFPEINKKIFGQSSQIIADLSTKMGQDLQGSAVQVGKALQDPEHGVIALRRIGVNFNKEQTEVIQRLVETGHKSQAQMLILNELNKEFGGSAKAAFDANPLARFQKTMGAIQLTIGDVALALAGHLANAFNTVVGWLKNAWQWFEQHKIIMMIVAGVIGSVVAGLILYQTWLGIVKGATMAWTAVQWMLNESLLANPITWIIIGIVSLIAIIAGLVIAVKGWGTLWDNVVKFATATWHSFVDGFKLKWLEIQNTFLTGIELIQKGWYMLQSLWDKEGAKAGLASISNQQNQRATDIAKQRGIVTKDLQEAIKAGKDILTLKGMSIDTNAIQKTRDRLKNFFGLGGEEGSAMRAGIGNGVSPTGDINGDSAGKINSGGQREIKIYITKQVGAEAIYVMSGQEAADEIGAKIREEMRRSILSLNGNSVSND